LPASGANPRLGGATSTPAIGWERHDPSLPIPHSRFPVAELMETKANYVLIGAFTIGVALFLLLFALWAAKYSSDRSWQQYQVIFNEPVTGLTEGSAVQYNGIAIGTVEDLSLAPQDPRRVIARVKLQADAPVKVDTRAKISMTGLTGSPFIQLTGGSPEAPRLTARDNSDVPVIQTEPSALQNIEQMTGAVADQREDLRALIVNARSVTEQLGATLDTTNRALTDIDRELVQKLPGMVSKLDATLAKMDAAAGSADQILSENRTAISSFANDGLAQLGPTLGELRNLIRDLRRISDRLDDNPAGYLLGRDAPKEFEPK
jgi:phospholipid/cholesterol/gamma-HCH transport system substrate-binding protein